MTVREAGQKGGETVKSKYGPEFYEIIGRKGGQATKIAHGHEFYEQIGKKGGKKGGEATRDRYGPEFYEEIGQKGGQKVKALIEEGKKAAAEAAREREPKARLISARQTRDSRHVPPSCLARSAPGRPPSPAAATAAQPATAVVFVVGRSARLRARRRPSTRRRPTGTMARLTCRRHSSSAAAGHRGAGPRSLGGADQRPTGDAVQIDLQLARVVTDSRGPLPIASGQQPSSRRSHRRRVMHRRAETLAAIAHVPQPVLDRASPSRSGSSGDDARSPRTHPTPATSQRRRRFKPTRRPAPGFADRAVRPASRGRRSARPSATAAPAATEPATSRRGRAGLRAEPTAMMHRRSLRSARRRALALPPLARARRQMRPRPPRPRTTPGPTPNAGEANFLAHTVRAVPRSAMRPRRRDERPATCASETRTRPARSATPTPARWTMTRCRASHAALVRRERPSPRRRLSACCRPTRRDRRPLGVGIDPARSDKFGTHVHYGHADANGAVTYGAMRAAKYADADGDDYSIRPPPVS